MTLPKFQSATGSGHSVVVEACQVCGNADLRPVLFLGYLPPVNRMCRIGSRPHEQPSYPAEVLHCPACHLVQLGLTVDPCILFPADYPYTSGTTRILRENFAELAGECEALIGLAPDDLVVDIGSNDGTLLSNFAPRCQVQGITPENVGREAAERGIPTLQSYFHDKAVAEVLRWRGPARLVTATNVFAHIENVHEVTRCIGSLLRPDGVFVSESHYLLPLVEGLQYDTVYHEHLRYYCLHSLLHLLRLHGLEVFHAKQIPTHGGSIRVYAARPGLHPVRDSVARLLELEAARLLQPEVLARFRERVVRSKLRLQALMLGLAERGQRVCAIGAPSRGSTLVNYVGLDAGMIAAVFEVKGSHKIGNYMPGTMIPILDEERLFAEQPDCALLLSWHIATELMASLRRKGYRGSFLTPLPDPRIVGPG